MQLLCRDTNRVPRIVSQGEPILVHELCVAMLTIGVVHLLPFTDVLQMVLHIRGLRIPKIQRFISKPDDVLQTAFCIRGLLMSFKRRFMSEAC